MGYDMQKAGQELAKNSNKIFSKLMTSNPEIRNNLKNAFKSSTPIEKVNPNMKGPDYTPITAEIQQRKMDKLGIS